MKKLHFKRVRGKCAICSKSLDSQKKGCIVWVIGKWLACSQRHADQLVRREMPAGMYERYGA